MVISLKGPSGWGREEKRGGNRRRAGRRRRVSRIDRALKGTAEDDATSTYTNSLPWNASCLQVGLELLQSSEEHLDYRVAIIVTEAGALDGRARLLVRLLF